ncbi:MAG: 30S ribosomal protein S20 [Candidatus Omnitrophica bacterium]|nr:30S ribosomal protein S20 [Candidatus Omnitrophota bacterium]
MPIKKAALKSMRSDRGREARNSSVLNELKTLSKKMESLISAKEREKAKTLLKEVIVKLHKAVAHGIIHKNRASRKIGRLSRKLAKLLTA